MSSKHSWVEGRVHTRYTHVELCTNADDVLVARLGPPRAGRPRVFVVEWSPGVPAAVVAEARRQLDFFLLRDNSPVSDPWVYARYWTRCIGNFYARVGWRWMEPDHGLPSFGKPSGTERIDAEKSGGTLGAHDVATIVAGYAALNDHTGGRYGEFLREASRCEKCRADTTIPARKQPIPLLCGTGSSTAATLTRADQDLSTYRRSDRSLRVYPDHDASVAELRTFLDEHGLAGLSIGHCGWGDLTARLRGTQLREGVKVMILGADWYPLSQCANFLIDAYPWWDSTLRKFFEQLGYDAEQARRFVIEQRVYLGNVLLCYRTGYARTGYSNLSPRSFNHCAGHLRRHLLALAPRILVTFGANGARTAATVLLGATHDDESALAELRANRKLKDVMEPLYAKRAPAGITCMLGQQRLVYVPLYHPSYGHVNTYRDDYAGLKHVLDDGVALDAPRDPPSLPGQ